MNELRQQMIDAVLVRGFSPGTHKSYLAAMPKIIVIEGLSATELVRFWPVTAVAWIDPRVRYPFQPSNLKAMGWTPPHLQPGIEVPDWKLRPTSQ